MTEKEKHLVTFHNICVMAHADGHVNEEEIRLLAEMARGMGLLQEEFGEKIERISELDFIIPEDEEEKEHELRMVILTMITDGKIDPREYQSLLSFTNRMGIERDYVDKVVEFYVLKQEERLLNLGIFQNLYLVAVADGNIDEKEAALLQKAAESLNLMPSDFEYVEDNKDLLDLVIPDNEEERLISLKNLVYMMMIDGHIDEAEYDLCVKFAQKIGIGEERIRLIMDAYEKEIAQDVLEQEEVLAANIDAVLDTFNAIKQIATPIPQQIQLVREVVQNRDFSTSHFQEEAHNIAFYHFLWLCFVHSISLNEEMMILLPMHLDLVAKHENWNELQTLLIESERKYADVIIPLPHMKLIEVQTELHEFYRKLAI